MSAQYSTSPLPGWVPSLLFLWDSHCLVWGSLRQPRKDSIFSLLLSKSCLFLFCLLVEAADSLFQLLHQLWAVLFPLWHVWFFLSPHLLTAFFMWLHPVFVLEVWEPSSLKIEAFVFFPALAEIYFFCVLLHLFDLVPATSRKGRLSSDSLSLSVHSEKESQTWMGSWAYSQPHWETSFTL